MNNDKHIRTGSILMRSILQSATFAGMAKLSQILFRSNLFGEDYSTSVFVAICNWILLVLIFESTVYAFHVHDQKAQAEYFEGSDMGGVFYDVCYVLKSVNFWVEYTIHALFSTFLPVSFIFECVGDTLWSDGLSQQKLYTLLILLPIFLVVSLYAHVSARREWYGMKVRNQTTAVSKDKSQVHKAVLKVALLYSAVSIALPWFFPLLVTIINLANNYNVFLWLGVLAAVVVFFMVVWIAFHYIRACLKRHRFINKLTIICDKDNVELSPILRPYSSLLFLQTGSDFSLTKSGKQYECKFIAGVFPHSPIIFSDQGNGMCQHTFNLFHVPLITLNSRIDFAFESKGEKVLIVLPMPKDIYTATKSTQPHPADTGEKIGDYSIYSATGFLHALERDCLN